jgi:hypothetical protein
MSWFKLDDNFHSHPKVLAAGNAAVGLFVRCGSYCSHYLTDGHVSAPVARRYGRAADIERLVESELWVPNGDGYWMPDYLEYNPSGDEVRAQRTETAESKRQGGLARARQAKRDALGHFLASDAEPW